MNKATADQLGESSWPVKIPIRKMPLEEAIQILFDRRQFETI
jgi:hypothetical protein